MARALVLNASYELLGVVPSRRALVLMLNQKAELLHAAEGLFHSEKAAFPIPSVVRLLHYVKVPYHAGAALSRRAVFLRDGGRCQYCSGPAESIDHVVPRSRGGSHTWENVVAACRSCNSRKRDRLLEETSFVLRRAPLQPQHRLWLPAYDGRMQAGWERYLDPSSAQSLSA